MEGLGRNKGEGRLACVYGPAGRGKTRTCIWWHAQNPSLYLRVLRVWASSDGAFLKALAHELGNPKPPHRLADRFEYVAARLKDNPAPVILDEIEKLPSRFLEIVRDLTDETGAPFVLVGEDELYASMINHRRVWSRTAESYQFQPLSPADIITYARQAGGVGLPGEAAKVFHQASGGDLRIIKRDLGAALRMASSKAGGKVDEKIAKAAVRAGLRPHTEARRAWI